MDWPTDGGRELTRDPGPESITYRGCLLRVAAIRVGDSPAGLVLRLHVAGYAVLVDALPPLEERLVTLIKGKRSEAIFNGGDARRRMVPCANIQWQPQVDRRTLATVLSGRIGELLLRLGILPAATAGVKKCAAARTRTTHTHTHTRTRTTHNAHRTPKPRGSERAERE